MVLLIYNRIKVFYALHTIYTSLSCTLSPSFSLHIHSKLLEEVNDVFVGCECVEVERVGGGGQKYHILLTLSAPIKVMRANKGMEGF